MTAPSPHLPWFSADTRRWFTDAFAEPTPAQTQAWQAISSGQNALVVAPTGSGKTLAAFLWAIDRMTTDTTEDQAPADAQEEAKGRAGLPGTTVLYVSPLKALAVDVERNLRSPIAGIGRVRGSALPITTGVRSGDTSPADRRRLVTKPPDILITTPESFYLMLTSAARETLKGVQTVIVDEVHAVASSKRGSHLALSLERLDELTGEEVQRIGLSATVRPPERIARFLGGDRPVTIVQPQTHKTLDLSVVVPIQDMANPPASDDEEGHTSGPTIWPHVQRQVLEAIKAHTSTLVFANSRRLAERLTTKLNEMWAQEQEDSDGDAGVIAMAHHGSVSKERRREIEDDLKAGRLPAVVATSSLELGIDMGAVDLVIQIQSPPSVASGLQRVGRAGHQVGAVSKALVFPTHRGDLLSATVTLGAMSAGAIEPIHPPQHPLDVLAQQLIAMVAMDDWDADAAFGLVRRSGPYSGLPRSSFDAVINMLVGRYPSEDFASLRPRLTLDPSTNQLSPRPGAQRLAVTAGGTIPDRGHFAVMLASGDESRRVGELDEEMVYESRVGDVFALGSASWRIEEITADRVLVSPAPGQAAKMPFWHGDTMGRPAELGYEIGSFLRNFTQATPTPGLDTDARANLLDYLQEQREATGGLPNDQAIIIEVFADEIGDRRVVIHSPFGAKVHAPWALIIGERISTEFGIDAQVMAGDDGIVLRLPEDGHDHSEGGGELLDLIVQDPATVLSQVTTLVGSSAVFASRFRECASRALLFGRKDPGRRAPLWQQRQRSSQLLTVAAGFESFPIVLETVREVVQDVYDVPALTELMRSIADGSIAVTQVHTRTPSPMARSLLFGYVAQYLYDGDSPLAERKSAALSLDESLLTELLGTADLRELLDEGAIATVAGRLQRLGDRQASTLEQAWDVVRTVGPLLPRECGDRGIAAEFVEELVRTRRLIRIRHGGKEWLALAQDAALLRDALGAALPVGLSEEFLAVVPDALAQLIQRYANTHGPFTSAEVSERFGLSVPAIEETLELLVKRGKILKGEFRPNASGTEWCQSENLRAIRRASAAAYAQQAEPIDQTTYSRFPTLWQRIHTSTTPATERGVDGLLAVIEQLAGVPMPASQLETLILPRRVRAYNPSMLDELTAAGEVTWWGVASLPRDGWVALSPSDVAPAFLPAVTLSPAVGTGADADTNPVPEPETRESPDADLAASIVQLLEQGGGWFEHQLVSQLQGSADPAAISGALWRLVWDGRVTNDSIAPLRALGAKPGKVRPVRRRRLGVRAAGPGLSSGRWSLLPPSKRPQPESALLRAEGLLIRHGIVTRGSVTAEREVFGPNYRALRALEEKGHSRRGYFVSGLGGAQFALAPAIDAARSLEVPPVGQLFRQEQPQRTVAILAAADPANPYGAALAWPDTTSPGRPGRKAGAFVVLVQGRPVVYAESGGSAMTIWDQEPAEVQDALTALVRAVSGQELRPMTVKRINGQLAHENSLGSILVQAGAFATPSGIKIRR
ncbi:DEAD/DEAH box helicase [Candidatus Nanopelagicales bacterium]|nr:DEAD/DEAH box helicase [Candidatus Nanopelagicales bacterium]